MKKKKYSYFAASNSYQGFINYFDKIFSPEIMDRIFILKGGPGTGKSTIMKRLSNELIEKQYTVHEIYCSSDPKSLDGVIAEKDNHRVAILDGTAPHEIDAIIPGAVDEIINLGDNWDDRWLSGKKEEIKQLSLEKKNSYQTGYNYLQIAGKIEKIIYAVKKSYFDRNEAKIKAESILDAFLERENGEVNIKVISSFGRYGKYTLSDCCFIDGDVINVYGEDDNVFLFLDVCKNLLINQGVDITLFPSALDPQKYDAILLNNHGLFVRKSPDGEINADAFSFLPQIEKEKNRVIEEIYRDALTEASRWFKIASDLHMRLEEIYTAAMDFSKNDLVVTKILQKIENIGENMH